MRISDWSSDVCSSDLIARKLDIEALGRPRAIDCRFRQAGTDQHIIDAAPHDRRPRILGRPAKGAHHVENVGLVTMIGTGDGVMMGNRDEPRRSEEHTSELQSLMRISYADFCLKKKKNNKNKQ